MTTLSVIIALIFFGCIFNFLLSDYSLAEISYNIAEIEETNIIEETNVGGVVKFEIEITIHDLAVNNIKMRDAAEMRDDIMNVLGPMAKEKGYDIRYIRVRKRR